MYLFSHRLFAERIQAMKIWKVAFEPDTQNELLFRTDS
jgi:hypothetical protein